MANVKTFKESMKEILIKLCVNAEEEYHRMKGTEFNDEFKAFYTETLGSYSVRDLDWLFTRQIKRNWKLSTKVAA